MSIQEIEPVQAQRASTTLLPPSDNTPSFLITKANKSYKHQYSNIYFVRLRLLRNFIEERANRRWKNVAGKPVLVPRVLDVVKAQLCYIIGTVYMEMPLKPNVLVDLARDHSIPPPPPPKKFYSDDDHVMLEDESGRIRLVGDCLKGKNLVTGIVIGALGAETASGDFEVVDICFPELAPQQGSEEEPEDPMDVDAEEESSDEWIGVVSGLEIGSSTPSDAQLQMLAEYLTGEEGGEEDQVSAARISRLIIAGNSLATDVLSDRIETPSYAERKAKKRGRGYDPKTFIPNPIYDLSAHLLDIARVMPIHILPGAGDPSGIIMPQQPFPRAMFGDASTRFSTFYSETNPTYINVASSSQPSCTRTILVNSGQPINDLFKYLPSPPTTRISILESTLRWRHIAPTAPDTLWCHPFFTTDPFILKETPHIYIVGGQPHFATKLVTEELSGSEGSRTGDRKRIRSRIVLVPSFSGSGTLVVINVKTLEVRCVNFAVDGLAAGGEETDVALGQATENGSQNHAEPLSSAPFPSSNSSMDDSQSQMEY